ncbi:MAG: hypothetical protein MUQ10_18130 [Anaerolineae bacterium]|nr:hypothetical protein [Anaerolineae bacterium]
MERSNVPALYSLLPTAVIGWKLIVVNIPDVGYHVRFEAYDAYMAVFRAFLAEVGS